jgi:hypothetical protein
VGHLDDNAKSAIVLEPSLDRSFMAEEIWTGRRELEEDSATFGIMHASDIGTRA